MRDLSRQAAQGLPVPHHVLLADALQQRAVARHVQVPDASPHLYDHWRCLWHDRQPARGMRLQMASVTGRCRKNSEVTFANDLDITVPVVKLNVVVPALIIREHRHGGHRHVVLELKTVKKTPAHQPPQFYGVFGSKSEVVIRTTIVTTVKVVVADKTLAACNLGKHCCQQSNVKASASCGCTWTERYLMRAKSPRFRLVLVIIH